MTKRVETKKNINVTIEKWSIMFNLNNREGTWIAGYKLEWYNELSEVYIVVMCSG